MPGMVTSGGADEAYYSWEHWGRFWAENSEVLEWLKAIMRQTTKPYRRNMDR